MGLHSNQCSGLTGWANTNTPHHLDISKYLQTHWWANNRQRANTQSLLCDICLRDLQSCSGASRSMNVHVHVCSFAKCARVRSSGLFFTSNFSGTRHILACVLSLPAEHLVQPNYWDENATPQRTIMKKKTHTQSLGHTSSTRYKIHSKHSAVCNRPPHMHSLTLHELRICKSTLSTPLVWYRGLDVLLVRGEEKMGFFSSFLENGLWLNQISQEQRAWPEKASLFRKTSTPQNHRLHGSSMATLAGSLWSLQQSPLSLCILIFLHTLPLSDCLPSPPNASAVLLSPSTSYSFSHLCASVSECPPSKLSTCFIFTVVAVLAGTLHCLGLIRRWSKREETDLNYPFHSLTASPLTHLNSSSESFMSPPLKHAQMCTHTHTFLSLSCSVIVFFYDQTWMSTNLCFLYSLADSEIIHVNYDSCRSLSFPSTPLPSSFFLSAPPSLPNSLIPSVLPLCIIQCLSLSPCVPLVHPAGTGT